MFELFDTTGFPPRWYCGSWTSVHGWLHIVSDLGIWSAYVAIPFVLGYFALRRRDLPFRKIVWLFGAFILACGSTHLMEAIIFWWPAYRLAGAIKVFTAVVSWATVITLVPITPQILALRSPAELEREIESRKRVEEALRQSNPMLRALVEASPLAIVTTNLMEQVLLWNPAAERVFGWSEKELFGKSFPEVLSREGETRQRLLASPIDQEEFHCRRKDGSELDVSVSTAPLHDDRNQAIGIMAILVDITERKRIEEARRRLSAIIEFSDDAIMAETLDGTIRSWNNGAERMFGYTAEEVIGKNLSLLVPFDHAHDLVELQAAIIAGKSLHRQEAVRKRKDGQLLHVSISASPLFDAAGNVTGSSKIIRDNTLSKQLQEKIQHAQKLESLGVLAGGIAHDFNNLLMGIVGGVDLALHELSPQAPVRASLELVQKSAMRAADLCHQMLAYSGKGRFVVTPTDLSQLVEEMGNLLEVSLSKKAVLKYHLAKNLPLIDVDATQIRQVIMNLITNGADAIGDRSGVISIVTGVMEADQDYLAETYLDDDLAPGFYVFAEVSDTGCGMDDETRSRIFDPFFTTKFTGRGLGLAAVLGIVRGHRGAIKVYSQVGRGTTIKVLFPCSAQTEAVSAKTLHDGSTFVGSGKVLVVDDDETVRAIAKRMFEGMGFNVLTANDGREGVEAFRRESKDIVVVLLDMTMPHMDGDEAFREIRRLKPNARVILSSGYNEQDATNRFAGKGLAGFIQKPYRFGQLAAKVREILDSSSTTH